VLRRNDEERTVRENKKFALRAWVNKERANIRTHGNRMKGVSAHKELDRKKTLLCTQQRRKNIRTLQGGTRVFQQKRPKKT